MKKVVYSFKERTHAGGSGSCPCGDPATAPPLYTQKERRGREREGRRIGGIAFDIQPPPTRTHTHTHPFNPATAAGAILMPLNADEVKMCLKEQIPVGRAAACMGL